MRARLPAARLGWRGSRPSAPPARSSFVRPAFAAAVVLRRKEIELTVEQELPSAADGARRRAWLTGRFASEPTEVAPTVEQLRVALRGLAEELDRAVEGWGSGSASRPHPERTLAELVETYRPRQPELVELLHEEGELSDREYELLRARVGTPEGAGPPGGGTSAGVRERGAPGTSASAEPHARSVPRPVPELLRTYQISSLRQAGAVRARRQISFEEYMALKKHFVSQESETGEDSGGTGPRQA